MSRVRHAFPDLVRAVALFGIAVVNVDFFANITMGAVLETGLATAVDRSVWWVVATLFLLKSYSLFALMFGYGIGLQRRAAEEERIGFTGRHMRRMSGLLLLGLLNAAFLFIGDILVVYSLLGTLLWLFRDTGAPALRRWAFVLYALQVVIALLLWLGILGLNQPEQSALLREAATETAQVTTQRAAGFAAEGFLAVAGVRFGAWSEDVGYLLLQQGFGVLAFMLYGLHAARAGIFDDLDAPRWSRARRLYLPLGLLLAGAGGALMAVSVTEWDPALMAGFALLIVGSPLSTMGYLGLVAAWLKRPVSPLRSFMARAGGASLTAYLLQGLLMSWVFSGYGLGWGSTLGAATYLPVGIAAAVLSLLFVGWWRGRYPLGPVETLLRRWVYLGDRAPSG